MTVFNDIGFDQLPKFKVPEKFLPSAPVVVGVKPIVPIAIAGASPDSSSSNSNNNMLLYLVGGAVLLFVGYTIYMADKDSKTEKKKTKKLDL
jgi:hypothetical protein